MRFVTNTLLLLIALVIQPATAETLSIKIGHLDDAGLSENFTKHVAIDGSGYIRFESGNTIKSNFSVISEPSVEEISDGTPYLKVTTRAHIQAATESTNQVGYSLIDPKTLTPRVDHDSQGEVTVYKFSHRYPKTMAVGSKLPIAKSETYPTKHSKSLSYITTTVLSLAAVNGESNLYQLCESTYDFKSRNKFEKPFTESDSCLLIDKDGNLKGYALLIINTNRRSTYTGHVRTY